MGFKEARDKAVRAILAALDVADMPGSYARGLLAGSPGERLSGEELLNRAHVPRVSDAPGPEGGLFINRMARNFLNFGADAATDPLNAVGLGATAGAARKLSRVEAANSASRKLRAAGAMPEEIALQLHPSLLENGKPRRLYHGTPRAFDEFDLTRADPKAMLGQGIYMTDSPQIATGYATTTGNRTLTDSADLLEHFKVGDTVRSYGGRDKVLGVDTYPDGTFKQVLVDEVNKDGHLAGRPRLHSTAPFVNESSLYRPNIRMHHANIRSPLNLDQPATNQFLADVNAYLAKTKRKALPAGIKNRKVMDELNHVWDMEYWERDAGASMNPAAVTATDFLKRHGYDAVGHIGGTRTGNDPHNVFVAFDKSQIYSPYVAPALQAEPDVRRKAAALAAYNLLKLRGGE